MDAKKIRSASIRAKSGARSSPKSNSGNKMAAVQNERDAFARQILDRMMPEFGPINFSKTQLLEEAKGLPTPDDLIAKLASESER